MSARMTGYVFGVLFTVAVLGLIDTALARAAAPIAVVNIGCYALGWWQRGKA